MYIAGPWCVVNFCTSLLFLVTLSFVFGKKINWIVGIAYFCTMLSAIECVGGTLYDINASAPVNIIHLRLLSAEAVALPLILYAIVYSIPMFWLRSFFGVISVLDAIFVIFEFWKTRLGDTSGGLLLNPSMNSSFIALCLPFVPLYLWPVSILAIFFSQASVPVGVLVALFAGYALIKGGMTRIFALLGCAASLFGAYFTANLLNDSGRIPQWKATVIYFEECINHLVGSGAGTYYLHGSIISMQRGLGMERLWAFAHNDWLQIGFESGALGLSAFVCMVGLMFYRCRNNSKAFAQLCGFCVFGFFDMPMRYLPTALLGAILVREAFHKE